MTTSIPDNRTRPRSWRYEADAWRLANRANERSVNTLLRLRNGNVLPRSLRARILALGLPADIVTESLAEVRHLRDWNDVWIETAQRFLGDFRRQVSGNLRHDAAQARLMAGLCYHVAQLIPGPDPRTLAHCRATAATLVRQALPEILPHARSVNIPWRNQQLPAILVPGPDSPEPSALVVTFNGTSTTKEELLRWCAPFDRLGIATLFVDTPGTGEARHLGPISADQDDLLDGVFEMLRSFPAVNPRKVGILGISIGGNLAIRSLVYDRRIMAAAVVSPTYEPSRWIRHASPLVGAELRNLLADDDAVDIDALAEAFSLRDVCEEIHRPTLVIAGGRDLMVPASDATHLASRLGPLATLDWYPQAGHVLYSEIPAWITDAAQWFDAVQAGQSTRVDNSEEVAAHYRLALSKPPLPMKWDDSLESTRLLTPEEAGSGAGERITST